MAQEPTRVDGVRADLLTDSDKTRFASKTEHAVTATSTGPALSAGMLIKGRYLLESKIGSGGMSDIYRATDTFLQRANVSNHTVAIKVLQQQFVHQPEALQLLLQEAHKTQQLSHPNIVRVFDVDCEQQHYFIVMEYLDGESLEQVIKRNKPKGLPLKSAINLLAQIADALKHAHKTGIVHADLKPANIMLNRAGELKVLDFGVSQLLQLNHDIYAAEQQSQTAPLCGYTPAYASPQLLAGNTPCVADDVFSFACLSYELLTSRHPFERLPADKAAAQHKQASKPSHISLLQWRALNKALQFDVSLRNISIAELMQQFNRRLWQPVMVSAAVLAIGCAIWHYDSQQQMLTRDLTQRIAHTSAQQEQFDKLVQAPAAEVLSALGELPDSPIQRAALLRLQQERMVNHFEQQIDQLLSDRRFNYPDYAEIEHILHQANTLYPDSHYLAGLTASLQRSRQTAIEVLRAQLNQLLLTQQYQAQTDAPDPYQIMADLQRIDSQYRVEPDSAETAAFSSKFNQAVAINDAVALQQLIQIGELIFASHDDTAALVIQGRELSAAVNAMAQFHQLQSQGESAEFPYQAAEVFYQHSFEQMAAALEKSNKATDIDAVYDKLQQFNQTVPADFSLHLALRRKLAEKYLSLSSVLLQSNQIRSAERVMRRANELMSSLNS